MIRLKGSRFRVSYDGEAYHVFTCSPKGYIEITEVLTDNDKDELIDDLVYCIQDLVESIDKIKKTTTYSVVDISEEDISSLWEDFLQDCKEAAEKYKR